MSTLPTFSYHPDPIATESVMASESTCACCGQARGHIYAGPVYATEEYQDSLCPWCIADGSANAKLGTSFTDESGIGGYGDWDSVPPKVIEEVSYRTPGFTGWQQEKWWTHCGDAGEFLGRKGYTQLEILGCDAVEAIRKNSGLDGIEWERFYRALNKDGSPTAYLFRCRQCGTLGGYQDCD